MSPRPPFSDPRLIRAVLEYAVDHSKHATSVKFATNHHNIQRWRDYRQQHGGPSWPTDQDIADWDAAQPKRAKMRACQYRYAKRKNLGGDQPLLIPSHGTVRRVQALCAIGWTCGELGDRLGVSKSRVSHLINRSQNGVLVATARAVAALYDELWDVIPVGQIANRVRGEAARKGWVSPLAWDDDTIDDQKARPVGVARDDDRDPGSFDESRIELRMAGDRKVKLHKGETAEVARRLIASGVSTLAIRRDYGIKAERYVKVGDIRPSLISVRAA